MQKLNFTPVIIIGSGRSGTNMLRDIITNIDGFETWDCDEINPIWRFGNRNFPTDVLKPEQVTDRVKNYIRKRFNRIHKKTGSSFVVEKTCANSLRLAFVYKIFPEAKFIIINRDGRDVVPSAMKRWNASFELKYTLKKLRFVPLSDLGFYVGRFGKNRIKKSINPDQALSFWGPLYDGIEYDTKNKSLLEVCANQWKNCVENTIEDRKLIPEENIIDFKYESFVENPIEELNRFAIFFNIELNSEKMKGLVKNVSRKSVGTHIKVFNKEELSKLNEVLGETLNKLNYNKVESIR